MGWIGDAIGGAIGAAGSVVGGLLGQSASAQANEQNYQAQKEFAQNGIRWRVADAKAAGLHPLAALGAQTSGYTPSAFVGDTSWMGDAAQNLGQSIGRAAEAKMTARERARERAIADQSVALTMENSRLKNEFLQTQIAAQKQDMALQLARSAAMAVRTQQAVPGMPSIGGDGTVIAGQAQAYPTAGTKAKPVEVSTSLPGAPHQQAGLNPDVKWRKTATGYRVAMSDQAKSDNEDDWFGTLQWNLANRVAPVFSSFSRRGITPPRSWLPPGHVWVYYPAAGEFRAKKATSRGQRIYVGN